MNNAQLLSEEESQLEVTPVMRERVEQLTLIVEALQALLGSSHWTVLQKFVFDVDLHKAKRRLVSASDTTEIFRLQGEIGWGDKFSLEKLLQKYRDELLSIRKKL